MNTIIAKYVGAFQKEEGTSTDKIKKILMRYAHTWDWANSEGLIADLIDDTNITADDIIDVLADAYEMEGGNEEFHYAVRALQICLRKAHLAEASHHELEAEEPLESEEFTDSNDDAFYRDQSANPFHHMKY